MSPLSAVLQGANDACGAHILAPQSETAYHGITRTRRVEGGGEIVAQSDIKAQSHFWKKQGIG